MKIKKEAELMNSEDRNRILFELQSIHPDIRPISTDLIVVADWVRLKCRYGCRAYGKHLCCPPFAPSPEEMRRVVSEYKTAILARFLAEPGPGTDPRHIHHYLWDSIDQVLLGEGCSLWDGAAGLILSQEFTIQYSERR